MDGARRAFDEAAKRGVTRRIDAGRDEIQQPASQGSRWLQLTALNAADGRLSYPKQFGRVRLFHAAEPADKPKRQRERARVFPTDTDHGTSIRLTPARIQRAALRQAPLPAACGNQHPARPTMRAVENQVMGERSRGQMPEGMGHRNKSVPGDSTPRGNE